MNMKNVLRSAGVLVASFAVSAVGVNAQGPLYDKVIVDLPYAVTLNETTLQPGHYVIRQFESPGGASRILQIFTDNGMKLKTSAQTIPALDNNTPENTKVILHHYGQDYYFDKIWIQGKNYGYEFPLPSAVKSREREKMQPYTVAAKYESTTANDESSSSSSTDTVSSATPPAAAAPAATDNTASATTAQSAPPASTDTSSTASSSTSSSTTSAAAAPAPSTDTSASAGDTGSSRRRMPHTSGNWLGMLLSGGLLSGAGMLLRRTAR
ncbi:MAG: hypothetical protein NVS1B6_12370 [Steroidobacteraceae bacterium]